MPTLTAFKNSPLCSSPFLASKIFVASLTFKEERAKSSRLLS